MRYGRGCRVASMVRGTFPTDTGLDIAIVDPSVGGPSCRFAVLSTRPESSGRRLTSCRVPTNADIMIAEAARSKLRSAIDGTPIAGLRWAPGRCSKRPSAAGGFASRVRVSGGASHQSQTIGRGVAIGRSRRIVAPRARCAPRRRAIGTDGRCSPLGATVGGGDRERKKKRRG